MARKAIVTINRKEISNQERFVLCVRTHSCMFKGEHIYAFFAGHRVPGTNKYNVRVYGTSRFEIMRFEMTRLHGHFQFVGMDFSKPYNWKYFVRFYRDLSIYRSSDLLLMMLVDGDQRNYITLNEAVNAIEASYDCCTQREGLEAAIAFASSEY